MSSLFYPRGYGERQKIMAVLVEGQFMEVFLTPQNLGGGIFSRVVVAGRSTLHVTDTLLGPRLKHLFFFFLLTAHRMCIHHVTVDFCTNIYTSTGPPSSCCYDYLCMRPIRDFAWILPRFTLGKRYSAATSLVSHVVCRVRCQKLGKTLGRQ